MKNYLTVCFSLILLCAWQGTAMAETLEQRVERLEKQQERYEKRAAAAGPKISGQFQLDFNVFDGAWNGGNNGHSGSDVFPRRARVWIKDKASKQWDYGLLLNHTDKHSSSASNILVTYIRYKAENGVQIKLGKLKDNRSLATQISGIHQVTSERPMVANAFSTGFNWGAQGYKVFNDNSTRLSMGLYKDSKYGAGQDANAGLQWAFSARGSWNQTFDDLLVHVGGSYSYRDLGGSKFSLRERAGIRNAPVRLADHTKRSGATEPNTNEVGITMAEVAFQQGSFRLMGEYGVMQVKAESGQKDLDFDGAYLTASYFLNGVKRKYNRKAAKFTAPDNPSGAIELFLHSGYLDLVDNNEGTKAEVNILGVNYFVSKDVRMGLSLYHGKVSGPGRTALVSNEDTGNAVAGTLYYLF